MWWTLEPTTVDGILHCTALHRLTGHLAVVSRSSAACRMRASSRPSTGRSVLAHLSTITATLAGAASNIRCSRAAMCLGVCDSSFGGKRDRQDDISNVRVGGGLILGLTRLRYQKAGAGMGVSVRENFSALPNYPFVKVFLQQQPPPLDNNALQQCYQPRNSL